MMFSTHMGGGVMAAGLTAGLTGASPATWPLLLFLGSMGAILPDIDEGGSLAARAVPVAGTVAGNVLRHRTVTHSLAAAAALHILTRVLGMEAGAALAAAGGLVSHLVLDSLTVEGAPWLWPLKVRFRLPWPLAVRAGSPGERYFWRPAVWSGAVAAFLWAAGLLS